MTGELFTDYLPIPWAKAYETVNSFHSLNNIESFEPEEFPSRTPSPVESSDALHQNRLNTFKSARQVLHDNCQCIDFNIQDAYRDADRIHAGIRSCMFDTRRQYDLAEESVLATHMREVAHAKDYTTNHLSCGYIKTRRDLKRMLNAVCNTAAARRDKRIGDLVHAREMLHRHITMIAVAECDLVWHPTAAMYHGKFQGDFAYTPIEAYQLVRSPEDVDGTYILTLPWAPAPGATHRPLEMFIHRTKGGKYAWATIDWEERGILGVTGAVENSYPVQITVKDDYVAEHHMAERVGCERKAIAARNEKRAKTVWARLFWRDGSYVNSKGRFKE
ncbi:hypothetical protein K4F52_007038 [Lecanicillium sp. MT-2017a]|nr:hypothetical protein K4F52_007038 [Lecanicillium sp. MT-2017a]